MIELNSVRINHVGEHETPLDLDQMEEQLLNYLKEMEQKAKQQEVYGSENDREGDRRQSN